MILRPNRSFQLFEGVLQWRDLLRGIRAIREDRAYEICQGEPRVGTIRATSID
jgi:hypothetical protein